jgi:hypothetical protein
VFTIEPGEKFGCLAFRLASLAHGLPGPVDLGYGCWVLPGPPIPLTDDWRTLLGQIESEQIEKANLTLLAKMNARAPADSDDENQLVEARVEYMYWGMAIAAGIPSQENIVSFSGANDGSGPRVRSVGQPRTMYLGVGMDAGRPTLADLAEACDIVTQLEHIRQSARLGDHYRRISSGLNALLTGFWSGRPEERVHQCVRAIEAFLPSHAWGAVTFVDHARDLVRPEADTDQVLTDLYRLRNIAEHHGTLDRALPDVPAAQRFAVADRRVRQAEGLARFVYRRVLQVRAGYLDLTQDDASLARFWRQSQWVRSAIWGAGFDLDGVV